MGTRIPDVRNETGRTYDRATRNRCTAEDLIPAVADAIVNGDPQDLDRPDWWRVGVDYAGRTYLY